MALLSLTCAIGSPFEIIRFAVRESVSDLFTVELTGVSGDPNLDIPGMVGQPASFELQTGYLNSTRGRRAWSGLCSHAQLVHGVGTAGGSKNLSTYQIRLVPQLWVLTQRSNHRVFQRMSIPDIVEKILGEWSVQLQWKITRSNYPKLEYKVQYGETDFHFVSRLLEEAGIAYAIQDVDDGGKVVFSDELTTTPLKDLASLVYEDNPTESAERDFVTRVTALYDARPGAHQIVDYNFRNPGFRLFGEATKAGAPENLWEHYEYRPGSFVVEGKKDGATPNADDKLAWRSEASYGTARAQRALEAARAGRKLVYFDTNVPGLMPGTAFKIESHPTDSLADPLLVIGFEASGEKGKKWEMSAQAVFRKEAFRPAMRSSKPRVHGVQTGTVVGPKGQEIHTDEFGRVRVQFPWDREGKNDDDASCWMRTSQGWAGTGFGMINIPRIGQEVLVAFLDGDPDQPVVAGRVFNALNPVPYKLPENKTVSGWKTNSSPTTGGYNEIKLEDKAHKELIWVQAQKDRHELVKRDQITRIERKHRRTVLDDQHFIVKKVKKELIEKDDHLHVKGDRFQKIDKSTSLTIGTDQDIKVGNKHAVDAGKEIHLKAGTNVVFEAGSSLTLKGPGGFVHIHQGGIDIAGTMVKINSGGSAGSGSGAKPTEPKDAEEALPKDSSDQIED
jgi:type VI secretion system secreted protein VgrG